MRKRRGAARNWHGAWQDFRVSEPAWRPIPRPNVIPAKAGTMNIYVQEERAAAQLYFQAPCSWIPAFAGMPDGEMNRYSSRQSWRHRKHVVQGTRVSDRVGPGRSGLIKKKNKS